MLSVTSHTDRGLISRFVRVDHYNTMLNQTSYFTDKNTNKNTLLKIIANICSSFNSNHIISYINKI